MPSTSQHHRSQQRSCNDPQWLSALLYYDHFLKAHLRTGNVTGGNVTSKNRAHRARCATAGNIHRAMNKGNENTHFIEQRRLFLFIEVTVNSILVLCH